VKDFITLIDKKSFYAAWTTYEFDNSVLQQVIFWWYLMRWILHQNRCAVASVGECRLLTQMSEQHNEAG
jgi:hypothetical protein